jgi:LuxR family maltose regulon positive regulatory protein
MNAPSDHLTNEDHPLLLTKMGAPRPPAALVPRGRLTARLSDAVQQGHYMTLVIAPAGYGKTTLVSEWVASRKVDATHLSVAWLSLDASDNNLDQFLHYLMAALSAARPDLCNALRRTPIECALVTLINALAETQSPLALVFDDYHAITSPDVHRATQTLIERMPEHAHLVLVSRAQPALTVGRLRAMGRLTEICADDLCFTLEESTCLLNSMMGLGLSADDVATLATRTEGWAAGLTLAGLALKHSAPECRGEVIAGFNGSHRFVRDYLREEVLAKQDDDVRSFLLHTAPLHPLHPKLCDAVTGQRDSRLVLERLWTSSVFVQALDRGCYRYHPLFAEFLREALQQSSGDDRICELERRAAAWRREHVKAKAARSLRDISSAGGVANVEDLPGLQAQRDALSNRELEVVQLMAGGLSNHEIAQRICVAPGTVKRHVHNILHKLNARNRIEAIAYAHQYTCLETINR